LTRILAYVAEALSAIWRNRTRSILTMLGMVIGTSSVIAVLGISKAAQNGISGMLTSFGDPGFSIAVDPQQDDPESAQIQYRDAAVVAEATSGLTDGVYADYQRNLKLRARNVTYNAYVNAQNEKGMSSRTVSSGRLLTRDDIVSASHVVVVSQPLAEKFFGNRSPVGEELRVGGSRFRIVGVYDPLKSALLSNSGGDDYIDIPYTTYRELIPGPVDDLNFYAVPGKAAEAPGAVETALHHLHGQRAKYVIQDAQAQMTGFTTVLGLIGNGLSAIGAVALVVAGIGIMNIMLVSVTERTREIGIRKAIGANFKDVMYQFLLEAVLLSLLGGGIGMVLGIIAVVVAYQPVERFVGPAPIPYLLIVSVAMGFSILVGTVFGTYPALRAAKLDPIEALRA